MTTSTDAHHWRGWAWKRYRRRAWLLTPAVRHTRLMVTVNWPADWVGAFIGPDEDGDGWDAWAARASVGAVAVSVERLPVWMPGERPGAEGVER